MGVVLYDLYAGTITFFAIAWIVLTLSQFHMRWLAIKAERKEALVWGPRRRHQVEQRAKENDYRVTSIVPTAKESPELFERAMEALRAQQGLREHIIITVMDGIDDPNTLTAIDIANLATARRLSDHVLIGNHRDKRANLADAMRFADSRGVLYGKIAVLDSDTLCDHKWVVAYLAHDLDDPLIGGVSSAQRAVREVTTVERVNGWLENARLKLTMGAGTYYNQVGCIPGRLGMYCKDIIYPRMEELENEHWEGWKLTLSWPFIIRWRVKCKAGDDRQLTNFVLEAGLGTKVVFPAGVKTSVSSEYGEMWKRWRRWGTSSQGYVIRTLVGPKYWLWKKWFVLYHYLRDIAIAHLSVFWVVSWPLSIWFSDRTLLITTSSMLALSVVGLIGTFVLRQEAHLRERPLDIFVLPHFIVIVTWGCFIRLLALYTPWRIGHWGTRDVDRKGADPYMAVFNWPIRI